MVLHMFDTQLKRMVFWCIIGPLWLFLSVGTMIIRMVSHAFEAFIKRTVF